MKKRFFRMLARWGDRFAKWARYQSGPDATMTLTINDMSFENLKMFFEDDPTPAEPSHPGKGEHEGSPFHGPTG